MSDEAHFHLNGMGNRQNCPYWKIRDSYKKDRCTLQKWRFWCAVWQTCIIGPFFFEGGNGNAVRSTMSKWSPTFFHLNYDGNVFHYDVCVPNRMMFIDLLGLHIYPSAIFSCGDASTVVYTSTNTNWRWRFAWKSPQLGERCWRGFTRTFKNASSNASSKIVTTWLMWFSTLNCVYNVKFQETGIINNWDIRVYFWKAGHTVYSLW